MCMHRLFELVDAYRADHGFDQVDARHTQLPHPRTLAPLTLTLAPLTLTPSSLQPLHRLYLSPRATTG